MAISIVIRLNHRRCLWFRYRYQSEPKITRIEAVQTPFLYLYLYVFIFEKKLYGIHSLTQDELAKRSGISKFTVRSYKQGKRLPRENQVEALAKDFDINASALLFWFFGGPNQAIHALFKLCTIYDIRPTEVNGNAVLKGSNTSYGYSILRWAKQKTMLFDAGKTESTTNDYRAWLDCFNPDSDDELRVAHKRGLCQPKTNDAEEPRS